MFFCFVNNLVFCLNKLHLVHVIKKSNALTISNKSSFTVLCSSGLQPEFPNQLHGILRWFHNGLNRRTDAEDIHSVWSDPRYQSVQGQRLCLYQIRHQRISNARHRNNSQHRNQRPNGQVFLGQRKRGHGCGPRRHDVRGCGGAGCAGSALLVRVRRVLVRGLRRLHAGLPVPAIPVSAAVLHDATTRPMDCSTRPATECAGYVQHCAEVPLSVKQ